MLRLVWPVRAAGWRDVHSRCKRFNSTGSEKSHEPLNILFCGSDEFSIYSLRALRDLQAKRPGKIAKIDVVCRPDKYTGRGMKTVSEVPIKSVATEHGLQLHQIDTFRGWQPPASINLVVAVSFGLLVPARILNGSAYGGLNVHPSLLPDLRGPAPIVHALLKQRKYTGVSLQTMHPTRFDHGLVLSQTPEPGIEVAPDSTPDQLIKTLGPLGAAMLCQSIEQSLFVDPRDILADRSEPRQMDHAPKITPEDRHINWQTWTAKEIATRDRVLGRLWDMDTYSRVHKGDSKRVAFEGPWETVKPDPGENEQKAIGDSERGEPVVLENEELGKQEIGFKSCDGNVVKPAGVTIDGGKKGAGGKSLILRMLKDKGRETS